MTSNRATHVAPFDIPEIQDYILDFLADDIPTLKESSLVCKTWSISSARHLFHAIKINPPSDAADTPSSPDVPHTWIFSRPRILVNVCNVCIKMEFHSEYLYLRITVEPMTDLFVQCMTAFPRLRSLHIRVSEVVVRHAAGVRPPRDTYGVRSLVEVEFFPSRLPEQVFESATLCESPCPPSTQNTLQLRKGHPYSCNPVSASAPRQFLRSITLSNSWRRSDLPLLLPIFAECADTSRLVSLRLDRFLPDRCYVAPLNRFLRTRAPNLERFDFALKDELGYVKALIRRGQDDFSREFVIALDSCPLIRTVTLYLRLNCTPGATHQRQHAQLWQPSLRIPLSVRANTLTSIQLTIFFLRDGSLLLTGFLDALAALDWGMLDRVLDRHRCLKVLEILFPSDLSRAEIPTLDDAEDMIRGMCSAKVNKILRLAFAAKPNYVEHELPNGATTSGFI